MKSASEIVLLVSVILFWTVALPVASLFFMLTILGENAVALLAGVRSPSSGQRFARRFHRMSHEGKPNRYFNVQVP